jgi:hypothetical protein
LVPGDRIRLVVSGLAEPSASVSPGSVQVLVGGVVHVPDALRAQSVAGVWEVEFVLSDRVTAGQSHTVTIGMGTRRSAGFTIAVRTAGS